MIKTIRDIMLTWKMVDAIIKTYHAWCISSKTYIQLLFERFDRTRMKECNNSTVEHVNYL